MTVIPINAGPAGLCLHHSPRPLRQVLVRGLRSEGPVIIMIHGFKYAPGHPIDCPHRKILSMRPRAAGWKVLSWPRKLGFGTADAGLGIPFGWQARGTIWQAYDNAERVGQALADLIALIRRIAPRKPVHAIAHSLGARLVLNALPHLTAGSLNRIILLSGAEFGHRARQLLSTEAGRTAQVINVTSAENGFYDFLLERLVQRSSANDRAIGQTLFRQHNVLNLHLDDPRTKDVLAGYGYRIAAPAARVCHWSTYTRPGIFELYQSFLHRPWEIDFDRLRSELSAKQTYSSGSDMTWKRASATADPCERLGIAAF